jgi:single-stranded-DNA-specific exonuclease
MHHGLQLLNTNPGPGLQSLIKISGLEGKEITVNDIVFKIAPIINAAGRIESGKKAVELMISASTDYAGKAVGVMNSFNIARKDIDRTITEEAKKIIDDNENLQNRKTTVLFKSDWHKGIIGIVASRLIDYYYRPTVILTESNGYATGSARSVEGYDLYKAVDSCSDLLENYGGHMYAAGLTMKPENIEKFISRFEDYVSQTIQEDQLTPFIEVDSEISFENITPRFYRVLKQFAPF